MNYQNNFMVRGVIQTAELKTINNFTFAELHLVVPAEAWDKNAGQFTEQDNLQKFSLFGKKEKIQQTVKQAAPGTEMELRGQIVGKPAKNGGIFMQLRRRWLSENS